MADSTLTLEGNFDPSRNYILKGSTLKAWQDALIADRVIPGSNLVESQTPQGRIFNASTARDLRPFTVVMSNDNVIVYPGALFVSSALYLLFIDFGSEELSTSLADGSHLPLETLNMTDPVQIASKDGKIGVWLCTDHLGAAQWSAIEWDDLHTPQSHVSLGGSYAFGLYFWPIAELQDGKVVKVFMQSDIFWNVTSIDAGGTTTTRTPPTPPLPPS